MYEVQKKCWPLQFSTEFRAIPTTKNLVSVQREVSGQYQIWAAKMAGEKRCDERIGVSSGLKGGEVRSRIGGKVR